MCSMLPKRKSATDCASPPLACHAAQPDDHTEIVLDHPLGAVLGFRAAAPVYHTQLSTLEPTPGLYVTEAVAHEDSHRTSWREESSEVQDSSETSTIGGET